MTRTMYLEGDQLAVARALISGKLQVAPEPEADDDAFDPSEYALAASAKKLLRRAQIYSPTPEQIAAARESARLEYRLRAKHAVETGTVLP
jgi:hypothetical protein